MTWETLQAIVGRALVDRDFAQQLLSQTPEALLRFDLTDEEYATVSTIQASSLEQFAGQLDRLLPEQEREMELCSLLRPPRWARRCRILSTC